MINRSLILALLSVTLGVTALVGLTFVSFKWGENAAEKRYEIAIGKIKKKHKDDVDAAARAATIKAQADREKDDANDKEIDKSIEDLANRDDFCISDGVFDELRKLQ